MNAPTLPVSERFALRRYHRPSRRWAPRDTASITPREWWLMLYERFRDGTEGGFQSLKVENAMRKLLALYGKRNVDVLEVSLRRGSVGMIGPHWRYGGVRPIDARWRAVAIARDERIRFGHFGARLP